ncbi:EamA family transporter [Ideonella sp.]|jgi:drug/metabolite transporter (DMT)-like permease|uniref:EamA family transporter n=1 Tax=Ideonella sp. TaxID=1929293 RepID=UPI0037BE34F7
MPLTALALVLVAALLHATWNLAAKKAGGDHHLVLFNCLLIALLWAPLGVWAAWDALPAWGGLQWGLVLASGLINLLYLHVLLKGYRVSDLTVVYPVARGSAPLFILLGAMLFLAEPLRWATLAGVLCISAGIWLIAGGPQLLSKAQDPTQRQRVHAGLAWGGLTGLLIATYTVIDGYAVKVALVSPILLFYLGNLLRLPFTLPQVWQDRARLAQAWRTQWRYALVMASLAPLAYVLVLYAVQQAPLSHVAPAREVSMLFAALLGGRLLGEQDRGARLAGAAAMALGVAALSL